MRDRNIAFFLLLMSAGVFSETIESDVLVTYSKAAVRIVDDSPPLSVTIYEDGTARIFVPFYMKQSGLHYAKLAKDEMLVLNRAFENRKQLSTAVQGRLNVENKLTTNNRRPNLVTAAQTVHYSHPNSVNIRYSDMPPLSVDLNKLINFEQGQSSDADEANTELNQVVVLLERVIRSRGHYEDL